MNRHTPLVRCCALLRPINLEKKPVRQVSATVLIYLLAFRFRLYLMFKCCCDLKNIAYNIALLARLTQIFEGSDNYESLVGLFAYTKVDWHFASRIPR